MKYCCTKKANLISLAIVGLSFIFFIGLFLFVAPDNKDDTTRAEQNQKTVADKKAIADTSKLEQLLKEEESVKDRQNLSKEFIQTHPGETLWNYLFIEKAYYNQFEHVKAPDLISNEEILYTIRGKNATGKEEIREVRLILKENKWTVVSDKIIKE